MKCELCHNDKELKNSHIIPEFFYKPLYDEKHRFNVIPLSEDQIFRYEQKGLREKLLCGDCENKLSKWEDYVRRIFYGGKEILITNGDPIKIEGIDYAKFKLFQLSLLWRASVSKLKFFEGVSLGPHEEKIRQMLLNEDPGSKFIYPCFFIMVLMEKNKVLDDFIYPPNTLRIEGHRTYRFIFGGGFWIYFVSSHTHILNSSKISEFFLNEEGRLLIPLRPANKIEFFINLAKDVVKYNKKRNGP